MGRFAQHKDVLSAIFEKLKISLFLGDKLTQNNNMEGIPL